MRAIWDDEPVTTTEPLWRYFKVERLIQALNSRSLHFSSARQFDDPFEGAVAVQPPDWPVDPRYVEPSLADNAFEQLRRLTKISCWHRADFESDAMWRLYAGDRKGVAIRTTVQRLGDSLRPFRLDPRYGEEVPWWGNVRYADLHAVRLKANMQQQLFNKHRAFEWEREFRVAISLRIAEEYGVQVPELGIAVEFDPATLIESIYIGPYAAADHREDLRKACEAAGVTVTPKLSTLLGKPRYI